MICPKCKNDGCQIFNETKTSGKDFSASKGCCGAILLDPSAYCAAHAAKANRSPIPLIGSARIADINLRLSHE